MDNETELLFWMVGKSIDSPKVRKIDYKKMAISVKIDNFLYLAIRNRCIPIVYKYRELFGRDVCEKISKEFRRVQQKNMHLQEVANEIANAAIKDKIEIIEPVSYTHLDVYKRQVLKISWPQHDLTMSIYLFSYSPWHS